MEIEAIDELLLRKEAARRKRKQLREKGVVEDYTDELKHRQLVVWKITGKAIGIENLIESESDAGQAYLGNSPKLSDEEYDFLADRMVSETTNGSITEIEKIPLNLYAKALGFAAVNAEAKLFQLEKDRDVNEPDKEHLSDKNRDGRI